MAFSHVHEESVNTPRLYQLTSFHENCSYIAEAGRALKVFDLANLGLVVSTA